MTLVAQRLSVIKPSATLAVNAKANRLISEGKSIVNLSAGEPDFDTPDFIKEAAQKAISAGKTKYTTVDGTAELKAAIQKKFLRENGLQFKITEISVGNGGKQVLYNALMASLNPRDEVVVPVPYWTSYPEMVLMAEGVPVFAQSSYDTMFKLTPEALERAMTSRTKWVILNAPSNPTGTMYSLEELAALGEVISRYPQAYVLVDDIYEHLIYEGRPFVTFLQAAPHLKDRTLTVNGVSKAYSMTGWRIGYGAGPESLIKAMSIIQSQSTSNPSSISQAAAVAALEGSQDFLREWRRVFQERRDEAVSLLNQMTGIQCHSPQGAFYVFPRCVDVLGKTAPSGDMIETSLDLASYFLEEGGVATVPGEAFGAPGFLRLSYATDMEELRKGLGRIAEALTLLR